MNYNKFNNFNEIVNHINELEQQAITQTNERNIKALNDEFPTLMSLVNNTKGMTLTVSTDEITIQRKDTVIVSANMFVYSTNPLTLYSTNVGSTFENEEDVINFLLRELYNIGFL